MIHNLSKYLFSLESKGIKLGLERTYDMLEACGNPHESLTSIQILGTNGKGSTASIIAQILKKAGYKVGLYTSPHLNKLNERVRINGKAISDQDISNFIKTYKNKINNLSASFFEVMTALAVWYFHKNKVDIAILETGLGGRLDSVSACKSELLVFTSISLDHQHILGDTIEEIAKEKASVIQENSVCISCYQPESVANVLDKRAKSKNTKMQYVHQKKENLIALNGKHQHINESLAIKAVELLTQFNVSKDCISEGLLTVKWPARIQKISNNPNIYFDVAHNIDSFISLCEFAQGLKINNSNILILALQNNKKIDQVISIIKTTFDQIIVTQTNQRNYLPTKDLKKLFNDNNIIIFENPIKAFNYIENINKNTDIFIAGSHYLGPYVSNNYKISFDNI